MFDLFAAGRDSQETKIKRLSDKLEAMDKQLEALLDQHQISPEQVAQFLNNPDNFSDQVWQQLQHAQEILESQSQRELNHVVDRHQVQKKYQEMPMLDGAIFVR